MSVACPRAVFLSSGMAQCSPRKVSAISAGSVVASPNIASSIVLHLDSSHALTSSSVGTVFGRPFPRLNPLGGTMGLPAAAASSRICAAWSAAWPSLLPVVVEDFVDESEEGRSIFGSGGEEDLALFVGEVGDSEVSATVEVPPQLL